MWLKEAITDGEIDALAKAARAACNDDTRYPQWHGRTANAGGHCYNIARWLVHRLGGTVGRQAGHYVWLSSDHSYYIDLTADHGNGWTYDRNHGVYHPIEVVENERTARFTRRADRVFLSLDKIIRLGLDYAGDAYPAEEPQRADDADRFNDSWQSPDNYWHDEPEANSPEGLYQFVYANGQLEVSPNHSHDELAQHAGIVPAEHTGPFAAGHVVVTNGQATWEVQANINLHSFLRVLKDATKNYGWRWGGMTDSQGQPITDQFGPAKSAKVLHYVYLHDHLYVGRSPAAHLAALADRDDSGEHASAGTIQIFGDRAWVHMAGRDILPSLFDWAADNGLKLFAGNDNVIKTIPDLQEGNNYAPSPDGTPNPVEPAPADERLPTGLYRCPACDQLFPNWHEYQAHRREQESWGDPDRSANGDRGLPEPDPGLYGDGAHYHEMRLEPGITTGSVTGAAYDLHGGPCENCGYHELRELPGHGWNYLQCVSCGMASHQRPGDAANASDPLKPVDPWMDNEPGTLTLPPTWSHVVVLPARSWKEAARVDGFKRYATAFGYENDSHNFYVAYRNGDPVGYAAVTPDGGITMVYTPFENQGIGFTLHAALTKHYSTLYTHAAHEKTVSLLKRAGWAQVSGQKWKWSKDQAATDMLEAPLPFIYDVDNDKIYTGNPGARTSDIPGKFTPGGIVEGTYEPGGKVQIRSLTTVPYTVRHLIELWYYTNPNLEVKSVHLKDDAGRDTRLATTTLTELIAMNPAVHRAATALKQAGGAVYAVGGVIRDIQLGRPPSDIDLLVRNLGAEQVHAALKSLPGKAVHVGKSFGVFEYRHKSSHVQVALPRRETSTGPGHTEFEIHTDPNMPIEDDLFRRDFTANAMACSLSGGELIDPYGGMADLDSRTLRTLGPHCFREDPLRVLRALSAASRFGLDPDPETRAQMRESASALEHLSPERIQQELDKIFGGEDPVRAIRLAHESGVLGSFLPEVEAAFGFDQNNPHHHQELGEHLLSVLKVASQFTPDRDLRLAALLHDIGKPSSQWLDPKTGSSHFYEHHVHDEDGKRTGEVLGANHEEVGAEMTRERLTALRYPLARIERITALVRWHMYDGFTTLAGARRFLAKVGDHADDLFILRYADQGGKNPKHSSGERAWDVESNRRLVSAVREAKDAFSVRDLAISGRDLIALGMTPGPSFKKILSSLTERVIEDPSLNERATLLALAHDSDA